MLAFLVAGAVTFAAIAVLTYPLLLQRAEAYRMDSLPGADFSERDSLLDALDELEHAFHSGKLSQGDYAAERARLELQYVDAAERAEHKGAPARQT